MNIFNNFKKIYNMIFHRTIRLPDNYLNMVGMTNTTTYSEDENDPIMIIEDGKTRYLTEDERKEFIKERKQQKEAK